MNEFIDEVNIEELERKELLKHNMPHDQRCCGEVAKMNPFVVYRHWLESKLKGSFKNKNIFDL